MTEDADIPPEMPLAFDEAGRPVAVAHPVYAADDPQDAPQADFAEKLARFLQWLTEGGDVVRAGTKAFIVLHLAGQSGFKTARELAVRLNISNGRFSQLRAEIIEEFGSFGRCNSRQN